MNPKVKAVAVGGGIVGAIAIAYAVLTNTPGVGAPQETIYINTNCIQTMSQQPNLVVYSGDYAATVWQWGFEAVNVMTGAEHHVNGVGRSLPKTCPMSKLVNHEGDCWQSVTRLAATPGSPKWLIAAGAPADQCDTDGLQVWKFNGSINRWQWAGFIDNSAHHAERNTTPLLDGDTAYVSQNRLAIPEKFSKYDLNALTVVGFDLPAPTTPPVQANIQGFTYTIKPDFRTPPAPEGPSRFIWTRAGAGAPTPTSAPGTPIPATPPPVTVPPVCPTCAPTCAAPTATATVTPHFSRAPTKTPTPHFGPAPTKP